jgi:hypothetical protein
MAKLTEIYLVMAGDYDGSMPVRAFIEQVNADLFADHLTEYQRAKPNLTLDSEDESWVEFEKWVAAHPGGKDCSMYGEFSVVKVPFGDRP